MSARRGRGPWALAAAVGLGACTPDPPPDATPLAGSVSIVVSATVQDGPAPSASASASASAGPATREDAVRAVFVAYRDAILAKRGKAAAALVAQETLAYYDKMRLAALDMKEAELKRSPPMDRLMILAVRHRLGDRDLAAMNGADLFAAAVDAGMVSMSAQAAEPDAVVFTPDGNAKLGIRVGTQTSPPEAGFTMRREADSWHIDVLSVAAAAGALLETSLKSLDPDPDVALLKLLELSSGKKPDAGVWKPLRKPSP